MVRMLKAEEIRESLRREIIGQDEAIEAVVRAVTVAMLGVTDPKHPLGTFLFMGPTGTGKSAMARALAKVLHGDEDKVVVVNCTEFKHSHEVSKLIGAPPGYVGHDQPPFITPEKLQDRFTVVVFEELEKAHPALFDLLLQVLDNGELYTAKGERLDFTKCFIIMTSNVSAREIDDITKEAIGFQPPNPLEEDPDKFDRHIRQVCMQALERFFRPEFINRIDEIIVFRRLKMDHLQKILDKFLLDTRARFAIAGIGTVITDEAKQFLLQKGTNLRYGARPLKRAVRQYLEYPLAQFVMHHGVSEREVVYVLADPPNDALRFEVRPLKKGELIVLS